MPLPSFEREHLRVGQLNDESIILAVQPWFFHEWFFHEQLPLKYRWTSYLCEFGIRWTNPPFSP